MVLVLVALAALALVAVFAFTFGVYVGVVILAPRWVAQFARERLTSVQRQLLVALLDAHADRSRR